MNTQEQQILKLLRKRPITTMDGMELGIMRTASRIHDLKKRGHQIISKRKTVTNRYGEKTKVAQYVLVNDALA